MRTASVEKQSRPSMPFLQTTPTEAMAGVGPVVRYHHVAVMNAPFSKGQAHCGLEQWFARPVGAGENHGLAIPRTASERRKGRPCRRTSTSSRRSKALAMVREKR